MVARLAADVLAGQKLAASVKAMRENVTEPVRATCSCGSITSVCNWYTVATCEYGEAVDEALKPFEDVSKIAPPRQWRAFVDKTGVLRDGIGETQPDWVSVLVEEK